jgi:hypothetical protein
VHVWVYIFERVTMMAKSRFKWIGRGAWWWWWWRNTKYNTRRSANWASHEKLLIYFVFLNKKIPANDYRWAGSRWRGNWLCLEQQSDILLGVKVIICQQDDETIALNCSLIGLIRMSFRTKFVICCAINYATNSVGFPRNPNQLTGSHRVKTLW